MVKELFQVREKSTTFNITKGRIDSVRNRDVTTSGCRVYDGGCIGVAGIMGEAGDETWKEAESNLSLRLAYPYEPETGVRRRDLREGGFDPEDFLGQSESLLAQLREEFPDFVFSNKISCSEAEIGLNNDLGLDLGYKSRAYSFGVVVRAAESVNIVDTTIGGTYRFFNGEAFIRDVREQLSVFRRRAELPEGEKLPVIISASGLSGKFTEALNGKLLGLGSSIFADKMNTAAFSEKLSLLIDFRIRDDGISSFFDIEGVQLPDDMIYLIEKGVIKRGYADKDTASRYHMTRTASAGGSYDTVPSLSSVTPRIEPSGRTAAELMGDAPCILVSMASGGAWTPDGNYAAPVQLAYLVKDGRLVGRLPEFGVAGSLYEIFGQDFEGVSSDKPWQNARYLVTKMTVQRK